MAISIKNEEQIEKMRRAGQILARVHKELAGELHEGMTTKDVDRLVEEMILSFGGYPNFKGYQGFPAAACVSVNDEIVHGIPSGKRYLEDGDIVSIDTGVLYKGYHSDAARTHAIGEISEEARKLIKVTEESFFEAIKKVKPGNHIVDIGQVVQRIALANGYSVVRTLTGHGIGTDLHEAPNIPNYKTLFKGPRLRKGMTLAIEPMINMGNYDVVLLDNNWTYATADGSLSSHYENTVAVTDNGYEILTLTPEELGKYMSDVVDNKNEKTGPEGNSVRLGAHRLVEEIPEEIRIPVLNKKTGSEGKKSEETGSTDRKKTEKTGTSDQKEVELVGSFDLKKTEKTGTPGLKKEKKTESPDQKEIKEDGVPNTKEAEKVRSPHLKEEVERGRSDLKKAEGSESTNPKERRIETGPAALETPVPEEKDSEKVPWQTLTPEEKRARREALFDDE